MAFTNGDEIARLYDDKRLQAMWQEMEKIGPVVAAQLYPGYDYSDVDFASFGYFVGGTGLTLKEAVKAFGVLFAKFMHFKDDTADDLFIKGLLNDKSTLPVEDKKVIHTRYEEEGAIFRALDEEKSGNVGDRRIALHVRGDDSQLALSYYLAAKGLLASEVKSGAATVRCRIVKAAEKLELEDWGSSEAFIRGLIEQKAPEMTPVGLFNDLNNRLQNLFLDPDATAATQLLQWVEQGGLKQLEPSLKAFLQAQGGKA
ncbi:Hypothetical protein POVN_LOCUS349 [uncultured virus]|nr:Hypothetical protein POVN_LOCUS349 [uncultured virus]